MWAIIVFMIICALIVLAGVLPSASVSIEIPPSNLRSALQEIAAKGGPKWAVDESLASEIVYLNIKKMPTSELQENLASAVGGTWVNRSGTDTLILPAWLARRHAEEALSEHSKQIQEALGRVPAMKPLSRSFFESWTAQLDATVEEMNAHYMRNYDAFHKARMHQIALLDQGPVGRLVQKMMAQFDPKELARIEIGGQVCYSDKPNAVERKLPFDVRPLLSGFEQEQRLLLEVLPSAYTPNLKNYEDRRFWTFGANPKVDRVLLVVKVSRDSRLPSFFLRLLDENGDVKASTRANLPEVPSSTNSSSLEYTTKIIIGDGIKRWWHMRSLLGSISLFDTQTTTPRLEALKPYLPELLNPQRIDPSSIALAPILTAYSSVTTKNLVVLVPDRAIMWNSVGKNETTVLEWETYLTNRCRLLKNESERTIVWRPSRYSEQRSERMNRKSLGELIRSVHANGAITVDDAAKYLASAGSSLAFEVTSYDYLASGFGENIQGDYESKALTSWYCRGVLRFLGALSSTQRKSLLEGGELSLSQLGPRARADLNRLVFDEDTIESLFKPWIIDQTVDEVLGKANQIAWERLPNGIRDGKLQCIRSIEPLILTAEGPEPFLTSFTTEWFGRQMVEWQSERPGTRDLTHHLARANVYHLKFIFGDQVEGNIKLGEIIPESRAVIRDVDDLPQDVRQKVRAAMAKEQERLRGIQDKSSAGQRTPPR